jgi:hypothetical protein
MYGTEQKCIYSFGGKNYMEETTLKIVAFARGYERNKTGICAVDSSALRQGPVAVVNTVVTLQVP